MATRCARSKCSRVAIGLALFALAGGVALSGDGPAAHAAGGLIERVGSGGPYGGIALSADGRFIAFTGGGVDRSIFIHDRKTTSTEAIGRYQLVQHRPRDELRRALRRLQLPRAAGT